MQGAMQCESAAPSRSTGLLGMKYVARDMQCASFAARTCKGQTTAKHWRSGSAENLGRGGASTSSWQEAAYLWAHIDGSGGMQATHTAGRPNQRWRHTLMLAV